MSGNARQGKDKPLHCIVASDRLFALGYSADEVNAYLSQTPFEELVQANLDAMEANFAAEEAAALQDLKERREVADAMMRSAAGPEFMRRPGED